MNRVLLVISHTQHYRRNDGTIVGWASTVQELDELTVLFDQIIHIGCLYKGEAPLGTASYQSAKVEFVPIPPFGGAGLSKLSVITTIPNIIRTVFQQLRRASHFQFRAPTSMGIYLVPLLTWFTKKPGWFKYAGNWKQENPPLSYAWQRYFLTYRQQRFVTISGHWPDQPAHCLTFENPCLIAQELEEGRKIDLMKKFVSPYSLCFVGRLEEGKGLDVFLQSLTLLAGNTRIGHVYIIGDGAKREAFEDMVKGSLFTIHFLGFLNRNEVVQKLKQSHFLVLPSKSEGFPKVVAEAWNYGCLPVVTDVSAIGQYVHEGINGFTFTLASRNSLALAEKLKELIIRNDLALLADNGRKMAEKFTYDAYRSALQKLVLSEANQQHE